MESKDKGKDEKATFHKRRAARKAGTPMTNPPLTPLIDVFLFLIIFFLLSCQFHQFEGMIPANLPKSGTGDSDTPSEVALDPIRVNMELKKLDNGDKTVHIDLSGAARTAAGPRELVPDDPKAHSMPELYSILNDWRQRYGATSAGKKQPIYIHAQYNVPWSFTVDAFNQAVRAGFTEVGVVPSKSPRS